MIAYFTITFISRSVKFCLSKSVVQEFSFLIIRCSSADGLTSDESGSIMLYSIIWQPVDQCLYSVLNSILLSLNENKLQSWMLYLKLLFSALIHLPSNHATVYLDNFLLFLPATKFQVIKCSNQADDHSCFISLREVESSFLLHSSDEAQLNLREQTALNVFQRCWLRFKNFGIQSSTSNNHYQNSALEHRIIKNENSWTTDLDRQNLTDRDMKVIVKYAIIRNRCKRIRLRNNHFTSHGISILSDGLYNNTTLTSLDLRNNQISDLGVQFLALPIIHSTIEALNLESNYITADGAVYLAQIIQDSRTLTELYLSNNNLGDRGVKYLANALGGDKTNTQEQTNHNISITNQTTLQHLYLGQNGIGDEGLKYLCDMLMTNRKLTWLWLSGNEISDQGVKLLWHALADYDITLEWLFLDSNKLITDSSLDDLMYMLKQNNTLKTLYINNCNLSKESKLKLLKMIKTKVDFDLEV
ncbi:unnamed protein product [Rotaria magnacalcarata]|uniref:Uncharacterized protein n=1 Tax=Rotaria magnacalcarata TaxID=392030 RepID=A0A816Y9Q7_9BILA|nr:unnamed protein product [Rotaria magnacalcarata]